MYSYSRIRSIERIFSIQSFALGNFAENRLLKLLEPFLSPSGYEKPKRYPQRRFWVEHFAAFSSRTCKMFSQISAYVVRACAKYQGTRFVLQSCPQSLRYFCTAAAPSPLFLPLSCSIRASFRFEMF